MLLVVRTKTAIVGTAVVDFGAVRQGNGSRLVEFAKCCVGFRVRVNKCFERSALRAALAHVNLVVAENDLRIDDSSAFGADASSQFVEDVIGILFAGRNGICRASAATVSISFIVDYASFAVPERPETARISFPDVPERNCSNDISVSNSWRPVE